jgi:hypothetical protein
MASTDALVGKYFHTLDPDTGAAIYQGQILDVITGSRYEYAVVQLFEWLFGAESDIKLFVLADLTERYATFYNTAEDMKVAYETKLKSREIKPLVKEKK